MPTIRGKWAGRFIWAAVVQGFIAVVVTVLIVQPWNYFGINSYFSPSKVIAGGSAGTWLFTGYISYMVVGVVAAAVTAIFYFYIEGVMGKVYSGLTNYLAWGHYVFMNVGVAGAMLLMIWGGYMGGAGLANGLTAGQVHVQYLGPLVNPIGAFVMLAALGALLGGLGFVLRSRMN
jgi:hypothetical protein